MRNNEISAKIYKLLCDIPIGYVTTYGELARAVGSKAPRAIGRILNANPDAPRVPCHRVVMSDGTIGGYAFGRKKKLDLLREEGVVIEDDKVLNFPACLHRFAPSSEEKQI